MKVLIVGGGGREHALAWKIAQSPLVEKLYCAPGNAGIADLAECVAMGAEDLPALRDFAVEHQIDLTVVGPEVPLTLGITDLFQASGLQVFGPSKAAAEIEGSKAFMKGLFAKYNIPTAEFKPFTNPDEAKAYVQEKGAPIVVKTSGLAAGKGAIVCQSIEEANAAIDQVMVERAFGEAGDTVIVEEFLTGEEASFIALVDGENILPLAGSQDHKAVGEGDTGLNTGGMGAYSPAPVLTEELSAKAMEMVMKPTVRAMAAEGRPYRGVLYAGLMIDHGRIKTLEFNARFGDPETQPILYRMKSDIVPLLMASANGSLEGATVTWDPRTSLCVVLAAGGYPGSYVKGAAISGLDRAAQVEDAFVFHAGTKLDGPQTVTSGGRVLGVTALGKSAKEAQQRAYQAVDAIEWKDLYCRRDIGYRAVKREES
ncbi:MAG: phosphoribosylamine--glycine ligase [Magnetococcales bacterium]|nr:phosphoribosylamine--glycine ligase [Magnetococcales bacterium]